MSHPMKKSTRSRINLATSSPVQYSQSRAQNSQSSWTAADAAKASKNGAFLTPWPPKEPYHAPAIDLFGQDQNHAGDTFLLSLELSIEQASDPLHACGWLTRLIPAIPNTQSAFETVIGTLPTQALDVGETFDAPTRLVSSQSGQTGKYIYLSCVWSAEKNTPVEALPATFRDTIYDPASRFPVDILCIIHESKEGKTSGILKIVIYLQDHSLVTITAVSTGYDLDLFNPRQQSLLRINLMQFGSTMVESSGPKRACAGICLYGRANGPATTPDDENGPNLLALPNLPATENAPGHLRTRLEKLLSMTPNSTSPHIDHEKTVCFFDLAEFEHAWGASSTFLLVFVYPGSLTMIKRGIERLPDGIDYEQGFVRAGIFVMDPCYGELNEWKRRRLKIW
ncbi:hypothetical protein F4811DRAFT_570939 [Daldinia bambusicola]|nr:hypothetical protein F4811DRAFT_570939 [Daldinia bambusicola]